MGFRYHLTIGVVTAAIVLLATGPTMGAGARFSV
jgi:hypothetical protein